MLVLADVFKEATAGPAVVRVEHQLLCSCSEAEAHERLTALDCIVLWSLRHLLLKARKRRRILRNHKLMVTGILDSSIVLLTSSTAAVWIVQVVLLFLA